MEQKLYDVASKLPEASLDFNTIQSTFKKKSKIKILKIVASLAACFILLTFIVFFAVDVKEYNDAVDFFNEHSLSTEGLERGEIKAVYTDITTKSFSYAKTAEVIKNSLSSDQIEGYEVIQENPTPEEVEELWNYKTGELVVLLRPYLSPGQQDNKTEAPTFTPGNDEPSATEDGSSNEVIPSETDRTDIAPPSQTSRPATPTATPIPTSTPSPTAPAKWKLYANGHDMSERVSSLISVNSETGILEIPITAVVNCFGGVTNRQNDDGTVKLVYRDFTYTFDSNKEDCGYPLVTSAEKSVRKYKNPHIIVDYESAVEFLKLIDATISVDYDTKTINVQENNPTQPLFTTPPPVTQDPLDYNCSVIIEGVDVSDKVYARMDIVTGKVEIAITAVLKELGGTVIWPKNSNIGYISCNGYTYTFDISKDDYGFHVDSEYITMIRKVVDSEIVLDYVSADLFCLPRGINMEIFDRKIVISTF